MIPNKEFESLTKREKVNLPLEDFNNDNIPSSVLLIHTGRKNSDGYQMASIFLNYQDNWYHVDQYDVFHIYNSDRVHMDFEYGGVRIFNKYSQKYNYADLGL